MNSSTSLLVKLDRVMFFAEGGTCTSLACSSLPYHCLSQLQHGTDHLYMPVPTTVGTRVKIVETCENMLRKKKIRVVPARLVLLIMIIHIVLVFMFV